MIKYKKIIIWAIVVVVLAWGGYALFTDKKAPITYTTEDIARGNLAQTVSATGNIVSSQQVDLSFVLTGRADGVLVDIGDKVVKGQRLATIDKSTFPQQLRQAELDIKIQKDTLDNMERNRNEAVYSKDQRDAQKSVIKKAKESYNSVLRQMRDNSLYAPVGGTIVRRDIDLGEVVMSGKTVFTIANPGDLLIESNIPEVDIVGIMPGQKAVLTFDALPEEEVFMGTVVSVDPAATVIQDVVFYRVKIHLDNFDDRLKMGMSCNDDIVIANTENILMIPQRAVKRENGKKYVEILKESDGLQRVEKVYVETGVSGDNGMIEVKGNLLKEGEKVVTFTKTK